MHIKTYIIDAFTDKAFKGNPAGVCLLENEISVDLMQSIANELNLSETAFLRKSESNDTDFSIRYFTPTVEIDFCGHATLASAKLVLHHLKKPFVQFTTFKNLKINATSEAENIRMNFPLYDTISVKTNPEIIDALGIKNALSTTLSNDLNLLLIEVEEAELVDLKPDFSKLLQSTDELKLVVVTAKSTDANYDFYSRCFCPWLGINEDPVTGATHTVLAKYWSNILNKTEMKAYQVSKRGGFMRLKIVSDTELEVESNAKIIFEGAMQVE